jgi:signal transduction histidine kinase
MHIDKAFLTSKVARRIFFLFIFCALLPLTILAAVTFKTVTAQLTEQAIKRLGQECKLKGLEIYNNLMVMDTALGIFISSLDQSADAGFHEPETGAGKPFRTLRVIGGKQRREHGVPERLEGMPELTVEELDHMKMGRGLVISRQSPEGRPRIFMVRLINPRHPQEGVALGEAEPEFLWGVESEADLIADMPLLVIGPGNQILFSAPQDFKLDRMALKIMSDFPVAGSFEYEFGKERYFTGYWTLFLKYHFLVPGWTIVMSESRSRVLEPVAHFKTFFFLFALLTFLVVCLLSVTLIRKNLVPIETLKKGTQQIAEGEFGIEVDIQSGDEFENLGQAFNEMSRKLKEGRALLVQSAKMGAVGQMAAGVVHEIGQPLTSISGLIDLLKILKPTEETKKHLDLMKSEMDRLVGIISRFKTFARVSEEKMVPLSVNQIVDTTTALLVHQMEMKHIDCVVEKAAVLPSIMGDQNSLQQVLINLMINAVDALEEKKERPRTIRVSTSLRGDKVILRIADNGAGIPKEIQERIFDPFFTTKKEGKGTGLGLAIIGSILHQHRAQISMESEVGSGTTFVITFPVSE